MNFNYEKYKHRIIAAYIDPGLMYLLNSLDKNFYSSFGMDIYLHEDPEKVPETVYQMIRANQAFNSFNLKKVVEIGNEYEQRIYFYSDEKTVEIPYDVLVKEINESISYIIKKSSDIVASVITMCLLRGSKLAHILNNINMIVEESTKIETTIDKLIFSILTGITAGFGGAFNRAILFKKVGDKFKVLRAIGDKDIESAKKSWKSFTDLRVDISTTLENYDPNFFSDFERDIVDVTLDEDEILNNEFMNEAIEGNKAIKIPGSLVEHLASKKLNIVGEIAFSPIIFDDKIFGFILCDNRYNFKPITEEQLEILDYLSKQASIIWENKISVESLRFEAGQDILTKFGNRNSFEKYLDKITLSNEENIGIIMIDIDDFKKINDKFGHDYGDKILMEFSEIVFKHIRRSDHIFRYGGDEFVLFLNDVNEEIMYDIIKAIQMDFNGSTEASFSAGAVYKTNENIYNCVKRADEFLYDSKRKGKNNITLL
ncbi:GGDEF domain-containing protein [Geotoga petraea]|jgi:diguanylate cyclase (GGDEF)-like protein|uniref:Diguanylate cyclase (GGDEF) domain-containing protein n=1 Tax=Geotoga petraea TaxID=28234 RepID=A0A1G6M2Q6_9BACT|nr:GGDEF domain-containing protein [Geotoga petraea]TGG87539.1 GGDEF domain-containing protein [Geotoga petraea]SDC49265.1 diguanylate cyclase (GGDEF) domain-containing protein [Geotoga petraea]